MDAVIAELNPAQKRAVLFPVDGRLQILAGPGTGKTKTLTTRVANLILNGLPPEDMVVMTFTKAAANEMVQRIRQACPGRNLKRLKIGTFHSLLWQYIVFHGEKFKLFKEKPTIIDSDDSETMISDIIAESESSVKKRAEDQFKSKGKRLGRKIMREISSIRNSGKTLEQYKGTLDANEIVVYAWKRYEDQKQLMDVFDFDDILIRGRDLLRDHPEIVQNTKTVLVDEFQDSNSIQLDVVKIFSASCNSMTVVGDPDQSIYGFRGAIAENMRNLLDSYPDMEVIYLEQNYRSTQPILDHATDLIKQEKGRLGKDRALVGNSTNKFVKPVLLTAMDENAELAGLASHVHHLITGGGVFHAEDVAILSRSRAPMLQIEKSLRRLKIPCHIVNGVDFWDRAEIKSIVCYLRLINNSNDFVAFERTINIPPRGVGKKTLEKILKTLDKNRPILEQISDMAKGEYRKGEEIIKVFDEKTSQQVMDYINFISNAKEQLTKTDSDDTLKQLISNIENTFNIAEFHNNQNKKMNSRLQNLALKSRIENIQYLRDIIDSSSTSYANVDPEDVEFVVTQDMESLPSIQKFLYANMLDDTRANQPKKGVTISTIHAAKGLEWPVVFVPRCTEGAMSFGEPEDDVRRLIYVAMTRPKALSYLSWHAFSNERQVCNRMLEKSSKTAAVEAVDELFPKLSKKEFQSFADFLGRDYVEPPTEVASGPATQPAPTMGGFTSAASLLSNSSDPQPSFFQSFGKRGSNSGAKLSKKQKVNS